MWPYSAKGLLSRKDTFSLIRKWKEEKSKKKMLNLQECIGTAL